MAACPRSGEVPEVPEVPEDSGVVLITAVVLLSVIMILSLLVMASADHANFAATRARNHDQSLQLADAGIHAAIARISALGDAAVGSISGGGADGTYQATISKLPAGRWAIASEGRVGTQAGVATGRRLEVTLAPPLAFGYAFFSLSSIDTKNNDYVEGDIWANGNILVDVNTTVTGSATSATGWIQTNGPVGGDLWSGGTDGSDAVVINGSVGGSVRASAPSPNCSSDPTSQYRVSVNAPVAGNLVTWGAMSGSGFVSGAISTLTCTAAPAPKPMPSFNFNPSNYDPALLHTFGTELAPSVTGRSDLAAYIATNSASLHGILVAYQSAPVTQDDRIDLSGITVTGDLAIITNLPLYATGFDGNGTPATVILHSTYAPPPGSVCDVNHDSSDCTIHFKNDFSVPANNPTLLYAPSGPVAIKNNSAAYGAVYAQTIMVKNNQEFHYDSRVAQILGYGAVLLRIELWTERSIYASL